MACRGQPVRSSLVAKAVSLVSLLVSVASFIWLWNTGMSPDHIGKILELTGAGITGIGLIIAWERSARRFRAYKQDFRDAMQAAYARITGRGRNVTIQASDTITFTSHATVLKQYGFPPHTIIDEKVYRLLEVANEIRRDLDQTEQRITDVAQAPRLTQEDADSSVAKALADFESGLEVHTVKDLTVAICGVVITMVGIILGMV